MRRVIALLHPSYTVRGVGARQRRPSRRLAARHGTRDRGGQRDTPTPLGFRANLYRSWIGYEVGRGREGRWCRASPPTFHQRSTELILSFNGTYRGLSPPPLRPTLQPVTSRPAAARIPLSGRKLEPNILDGWRRRGVPFKEVNSRVWSVVIVREYHNQRCTSSLKGRFHQG